MDLDRVICLQTRRTEHPALSVDTCQSQGRVLSNSRSFGAQPGQRNEDTYQQDTSGFKRKARPTITASRAGGVSPLGSGRPQLKTHHPTAARGRNLDSNIHVFDSRGVIDAFQSKIIVGPSNNLWEIDVVLYPSTPGARTQLAARAKSASDVGIWCLIPRPPTNCLKYPSCVHDRELPGVVLANNVSSSSAKGNLLALVLASVTKTPAHRRHVCFTIRQDLHAATCRQASYPVGKGDLGFARRLLRPSEAWGRSSLSSEI
ncbi:hypothetical protein NEOLEDRAFT_1147413 [Neolentinus lepideus HHB14362 ss-1]|uniref:Uncharacterized protein n=1 Tax=Neolentinus lepideus HHB14362 ss-1 TaxID=1314782 RepID=A0A165TAM8_9AGAM|nr:hypothetical protein NEOLEDRAFT_1147413 [Neolentinus lepideus HHB14362 ss-1]